MPPGPRPRLAKGSGGSDPEAAVGALATAPGYHLDDQRLGIAQGRQGQELHCCHLRLGPRMGTRSRRSARRPDRVGKRRARRLRVLARIPAGCTEASCQSGMFPRPADSFPIWRDPTERRKGVSAAAQTERSQAGPQGSAREATRAQVQGCAGGQPGCVSPAPCTQGRGMLLAPSDPTAPPARLFLPARALGLLHRSCHKLARVLWRLGQVSAWPA